MALRSAFLIFLLLQGKAYAQCPSTPLQHDYSAEIGLKTEWNSNLVINDLTKPRGMVLDSEGNLLLVDVGIGVISYQMADRGDGSSCLIEKKVIVADKTYNHGIAFSRDGKTLFVSSRNSVYAYSYDANSRNITSNPHEIITAMDNNGHITRTLFVHENYILVSAGSEGNLDPKATELDSGHSVIKFFDLKEAQVRNNPYKFPTEGSVLGWGLRNSVGLTVDPRTGGIWSVENSIDNFMRDEKKVSEDNPGEELNFLGYVNETLNVPEYEGKNYGYPSCVAVWDVESLPDNQGLQVGDQILVDDSSTRLANNDTDCRNPERFTPPRLTFQAHMAPLDVHFNNFADKPEVGGDGDLWVTFHGSWNRDTPVGYKLSKISFDKDTGMPVAKVTDKQNYEDIMWNNNLMKCDNNGCFRPVGVVVDKKGRVWLGSDATGEVFVLWRNSDEGGNDGSGGGGSGDKNQASKTPGRLWASVAIASFLGMLFM